MEKSTRKTKTSIIYILYIIIITTISLFTINNFLLIKKYNKINNNLNIKYNKNYNTYKTINDKKDILINEINKLDNIEEEIKNIKNEVFTLAKKVEEKILNGSTNVKIAYLTFDDGPYHLTDSVLDVLKSKKVKATFFTIGLNKEICFDNKNYSCSETYNKIVSNGHTIANHTYSHLIFNGLYSSSNEFLRQVKLQEDLIYSKTNVKTNILRFPGGSSSARYLKDEIIAKLKDNNYGWVDWTAFDGDGGGLYSIEQAWDNLYKSINENIEVVLFHDYNKITYSILPDVIDYLENNNYILLPLFYDSVMVNK